MRRQMNYPASPSIEIEPLGTGSSSRPHFARARRAQMPAAAGAPALRLEAVGSGQGGDRHHSAAAARRGTRNRTQPPRRSIPAALHSRIDPISTWQALWRQPSASRDDQGLDAHLARSDG